ncbi:MAG TPA: Bax inhibitor-1/YccA family protein [Micromonosporaceae bacterium]|nr:Bax inhibitor-1/YccA family protein [Micromonosporaceae bacterium]
MQSSNPVLTRLGEASRQERSTGTMPGYGYQPSSPVQGDRSLTDRAMTLDDVVVRTIGLLALTGATAAFSWVFLADSALAGVAMIGSVIAALVLGLVITFKQITNPYVISGYALLQGVLLGVVSRFYNDRFDGIVIQAVIGTFGVFAVMAVLYKMKVLRATPKFAKAVIGALIGVVVLILVNFVASMFTENGLGLRDNGTGPVGALPIIFSLVVIVVGALTFILDFDQVEKGVQHGLPEKYAWYCAFGLLVGLVFLYYEILRLLSYLRR